MSSYRRQVHHPLALGRAKRQVQRHAWEFQAVPEGTGAPVTYTVQGSELLSDILTAFAPHIFGTERGQ